VLGKSKWWFSSFFRGVLCADFFFSFSSSLAYCEVYIMAALVALQIIPRARLVDTTIEDISYDHDLIVLQTKKGSISVKIQID
jgi:hypothetical protein